MHIKYKRISPAIGPVCLGIFILTITALLCPNVQSSASAAESQAADVPASAGGDSLSIAISNSKINLTADPTVDNGVVKSSLDISAKTTNPTGYTLKISTPNTAMQPNNSSINATIPTLSSVTTLGSFPDNRWGYYTGTDEGTNNSQFAAFSTNGVTIDSTTAANDTARNKKLTIAAKVSTSLPASTYNSNILLSIVANPWLPALSSMQAMTSAYCSSVPEGDEAQLTDIRDNKKYWVRRQPDGRCWMVQNLALDLSVSKTLTPNDTNISTNWKPNSSTQSGALKSSTDDISAVGSWSGGQNFVNKIPFSRIYYPEYGCGVNIRANGTENIYTHSTSLAAGAGTDQYGNPTAACTTYFTNVSGWQDTYEANINKTSGNTIDTNNKTYDAHYLVGNYYSLMAASAGTWDQKKGSTLTASICPKGWKLPNKEEIQSLAKAVWDGKTQTDENATEELLPQKPFYLLRGGYVNTDGIHNAGDAGKYWGEEAVAFWGIEWTYTFTNTSYSEASGGRLGQSIRCINDPSI